MYLNPTIYNVNDCYVEKCTPISLCDVYCVYMLHDELSYMLHVYVLKSLMPCYAIYMCLVIDEIYLSIHVSYYLRFYRMVQ